jgi:hypothetical protein
VYLFADLNENGTFDSGETERTYTVQGSISISRFCGTLSNGTTLCSNNGLSGLDVTYLRPEGATTIKQYPSGSVYATSTIYLTGGGLTREIQLSSGGKIESQ